MTHQTGRSFLVGTTGPWVLAASLLASGLMCSAMATTVTTPTTVTMADGTIVITLPGGTTVTYHPNRGTTVTYPDGSKTEKQKGSTSTTTTRPDGTKVIHYEGGATTTIFPSGGSVTKTSDGIVITTFSGGGKTTIYPDGSVETDPRGGGDITTVKKDGVTIVRKPDGTTITTYPEGTTVTQLPDGTRITKHYDGRTVTRRPDGTTSTTYSDPRQPNASPTISSITGSPGALQVAPLQQARPAAGTVVPGESPAKTMVPLPSIVKTPSSVPVSIPYANSNFQVQLGGLPTKSVTKIDVPSTTQKTSTGNVTTPVPQRAFGVVPRGVEELSPKQTLPILVLEDTASFAAPKSGRVTVPAGEYAVMVEQDRLRLTQPDGGHPSFTLGSQPAVYRGSLDGSALLWLPTEEQDAQLLLWLGPNGQARFATMHRDHVRTRGTSPILAPHRFLLPGGGLLRLAPPNPHTGVKQLKTGHVQPLRVQTCGTGAAGSMTAPPQRNTRPVEDGDCQDLNPGALHVVVTNFLGTRSQSVVEDRAGGALVPRSVERDANGGNETMPARAKTNP